MLYSIGKDSTVLLHIAKKHSIQKNSFPLLHVDTTWKFKDMYKIRDVLEKDNTIDLIVFKNQDDK